MKKTSTIKPVVICALTLISNSLAKESPNSNTGDSENLINKQENKHQYDLSVEKHIIKDSSKSLQIKGIFQDKNEKTISFQNAGLIKNSKITINKNVLDEIRWKKNGLAEIFIPKLGHCYVKKDGSAILMKTSDNGADHFVEGLARYSDLKNKTMGFINEKGDIEIQAQFEWAFPFNKNHALVAKEVTFIKDGEYSTVSAKKWGCIDKKGKLVIPIEFDYKEISAKHTKLTKP